MTKLITVKRKLIEGVYAGEMKYKRFHGMTKQEFYDMNQKAIEKYLSGIENEQKRQLVLTNMFTDIVEGD